MNVRDTNDNKPIFTKNVYEVKIGQRHKVGEKVVTVRADDTDSGALGKVCICLSLCLSIHLYNYLSMHSGGLCAAHSVFILCHRL